MCKRLSEGPKAVTEQVCIEFACRAETDCSAYRTSHKSLVITAIILA